MGAEAGKTLRQLIYTCLKSKILGPKLVVCICLESLNKQLAQCTWG